MHLIQQSTWNFVYLFPAAEKLSTVLCFLFGHFEWKLSFIMWLSFEATLNGENSVKASGHLPFVRWNTLPV
jgi:hypothetical protein